MSEFTNNNRLKTERLTELARVVISKEKVADHVKSNMDLLENVTPPDVVTLVHNLVEDGYDMEELKKHVAKLLNLFYKAINNTEPPAPPKGSLIYYLQENAREMSRKLDELKLKGYRFDDLVNERWIFRSQAYLEGHPPVEDVPIEVDE
jgi:DUF438 domain-containing protein